MSEIFCTQRSTYNASVVDHMWVGLYTELGTFCAIPAHIELKWPRMLKKVVKNVRSAPKHHPKDESVLESEIKKTQEAIYTRQMVGVESSLPSTSIDWDRKTCLQFPHSPSDSRSKLWLSEQTLDVCHTQASES